MYYMQLAEKVKVLAFTLPDCSVRKRI